MSQRSEPQPRVDLPVIVIGGGVSGLAVAYHLAQGGAPVRLLEASSRLGGNICTETHDGFLYDVGPDSFLRTKPEARELCETVGLGGELIAPEPAAARVYVAQDGVLHPMPEGLSLGVPTRPGALLATSLLSAEGKLRAFCEPFVPRRQSGAEETILEFMTRRLGPEMAIRVAAPLLSGVFAGDAARLSMEATFPQISGLERRFGSLFFGMNGGKSLWAALLAKRTPVQSPFLSLRSGLGALIEALARALPQGTIQLGQAVRAVLPPRAGEPAGVLLEDGSPLPARHVVVAGPPWAASRLLGQVSTSMSASLGEVRGCPTATVFLGLRLEQLERELDGSGFIVPPGEGEILASTWISSKWSGRAPQGFGLVRAFVGGARGGSSLDREDAELATLAQRELERFMGSLGTPLFVRVFRYERGTPQPEVGHLERLQRMKAALSARPWLSVIGSGYGGVGIPDCARQAREVARGLLKGAPDSGVV